MSRPASSLGPDGRNGSWRLRFITGERKGVSKAAPWTLCSGILVLIAAFGIRAYPQSLAPEKVPAVGEEYVATGPRRIVIRDDAMPTVLITSEPLYGSNGSHVTRLRAGGFEIAYPPRVPLVEEDEVIESLPGIAAVIAGSEPYSQRVLAHLPDLQIISRCGVGLDQVDLGAAALLGIAVAITPDGNHEAVAEHTMALLLALTRSIVRNDREVRRGLWGKTTLVPLRGKTLGIIGLGRI